jgi:hypothetical protein
MRRVPLRNRSRLPDPDSTTVDRVLTTLVEGRVHRLLSADQFARYERFLWEEAAPAGRYVVAFPLACGCLAWLGFTIERARRTPRGVMVRAHAAAARVPDHEGRTPACPDVTPPAELAGWPRWHLDLPQLTGLTPRAR